MASLTHAGFYKYNHKIDKNSQVITSSGSGDSLTSTIDAMTRCYHFPEAQNKVPAQWTMDGSRRLGTS
jgi:glutamate mutase epsilon subunit